jgi:hypothetical protein
VPRATSEVCVLAKSVWARVAVSHARRAARGSCACAGAAAGAPGSAAGAACRLSADGAPHAVPRTRPSGHAAARLPAAAAILGKERCRRGGGRDLVLGGRGRSEVIRAPGDRGAGECAQAQDCDRGGQRLFHGVLYSRAHDSPAHDGSGWCGTVIRTTGPPAAEDRARSRVSHGRPAVFLLHRGRIISHLSQIPASGR